MMDGPRYVVGLRDPKQSNLYKDMIEGEKEGEAKQQAEELAAKEGRATIVWDRKNHEVIHRVAGKDDPVEKQETKPEPKKRGRRKQEDAS
jgi:hypothetical protein